MFYNELRAYMVAWNFSINMEALNQKAPPLYIFSSMYIRILNQICI